MRYPMPPEPDEDYDGPEDDDWITAAYERPVVRRPTTSELILEGIRHGD